MKERKPVHPMPKEIMHNPVGIFPWDPLGSYTGRPEDRYEQPVQDADDL